MIDINWSAVIGTAAGVCSAMSFFPQMTIMKMMMERRPEQRGERDRSTRVTRSASY
jgi:hypothetical protein